MHIRPKESQSHCFLTKSTGSICSSFGYDFPANIPITVKSNTRHRGVQHRPPLLVNLCGVGVMDLLIGTIGDTFCCDSLGVGGVPSS